MNGLVCLSLADASGFAVSLNSDMGYPRAGTDAPGGYHQPGGGTTTGYGLVKQHPTLTTAAFYPYDGTVQGRPVALPVGSAVQVLNPVEWFPAPLIGQVG